MADYGTSLANSGNQSLTYGFTPKPLTLQDFGLKGLNDMSKEVSLLS